MLRKSVLFLAVVSLLLAGSVLANIGKVPIRNLPVVGGASEPLNTKIGVESDNLPPSTLDSVGVGYVAGTTYYDYQHNGTAGHMVTVDSLGYVHVVWMNALAATLSPRHVYYNVWDPSSQAFNIPGGGQVNSSNRAGYTCAAVKGNGFCFPNFHEIAPDDAGNHAASAIDFLPQSGAFTTFKPTYVYENNAAVEYIWPKIAIDRHDKLHMIAAEASGTGVPQRLTYSRGLARFDADGFGLDILWDNVGPGSDQYVVFDTAMVIAPMLACSKTSDRVVIAWSKSRDDLANSPSQYNNDLWMIVSEDGGVNWGPEINITNFIYPDYPCASGDTLECDKDTFRVYTDCNVIFDAEDNVHTAFTTCYFYELEGMINIVFSDIWHWSEEIPEFSPVAHGYFDSSEWIEPGAWQRVVHRPCLSVDWTTGYMYCSFQTYDSLQTGESGFPQGEAYISVSADNGRIWSQALNVSTTDGGVSAPAGTSKSERDVTISDRVNYANGTGYVNMEYVFDRDAGGIPQEEGIATLNPVIFRRIPITDIPLTPIHDPFFPVLHVDSTAMPGSIVPLGVADDRQALRPGTFQLYQNYPNPFNPSTNIQFDLIRDAAVSLKIFNVLGQQVATVYDNKVLSAGAKTVAFDASTLASGVYVYRLEVGGIADSRKMVLMK